MAAGHDARNYYYETAACPEEFELGTVFKLPEIKYGIAAKDWICLDRGGAITIHYDDSGNLIVDLDLLVDRPVVTGLLEAGVMVDIPVYEQVK